MAFVLIRLNLIKESSDNKETFVVMLEKTKPFSTVTCLQPIQIVTFITTHEVSAD